MKTILIVFIIWTVLKALSDRAGNRVPEQLPENREEPAAYRLPPELQEKWGAPADHKQTLEQAVPVPPAASPAGARQPQPADPKPLRVPDAAREAKPPAAQECREIPDRLLNGPALRQGIILSEILGPPAARRRRSRPTIN
ncbi:hypothetical protein [Desulforamulus hydrothermalis]|uniref:Uncharacterized protein n=1 Tax=Desulforamulus hydrothermalis Lam5 = DSM 18033 TaxID=1121428 RepID=K8E0Q1_9FIRM|nr:hypothetical protein [Desulforamulus hydrothermalis]CCO09095.1 conserved hypothetical protein [Desulforamulus hydrothermalis Lam5 = DSM 18033]SHH12663.1 hypothetical protein SAMN02745177_01557 [Desulforamulus hydrothermalis Lam5 = DSM 18033]